MSSLMRVGPRQYSLNKPLVNKKDKEEANKQVSSETQEQSGDLRQSKGLAYTQDSQLPSAEQSRPQNLNYATNSFKAQQKEHQALPFSQRNTKINIAQILKDFKNTALAIGTPTELIDEVDGYLDLIKKVISCSLLCSK